MEKNHGVTCDVKNCKHNEKGCNCKLGKIKVTCGCGKDCTCCGSYEELFL